MIKLVVGTKGKGKTKYMVETANDQAKHTDGIIVYLDKNSDHMFQLDRNIRLINVGEYPIPEDDALVGFICGLSSGNHDIETIYLDSYLTIAKLSHEQAPENIEKLLVLSEKLGVELIVSVSVDESELPDDLKEFIVPLS